MTEKQKEFARLLVEGKLSKPEAYRKAFKKKGLSNEAASKAASRLSKNDEVLSYIDELNAKLDKKTILTKKERMEWLTRLIVTSPGEVDSNSELCQEYRMDDAGNVICKMPSKLGAIAELNKMDGAYEPERTETKVSFGDEIMDALSSLRGEVLPDDKML